MNQTELEELRCRVISQLRELDVPNDSIRHLTVVADVAVRVADQIIRNGYLIEIQDVLVGALLHDVGYTREGGIRHGLAGAQIAKELGYSEKIARIVETHILGGIPKEMVATSNLNLPAHDFLPLSLEERIVAFADQLVHLRSRSKIFLIEDPSRDKDIAMNIYHLYEEVLEYCFLPPKHPL